MKMVIFSQTNKKLVSSVALFYIFATLFFFLINRKQLILLFALLKSVVLIEMKKENLGSHRFAVAKAGIF